MGFLTTPEGAIREGIQHFYSAKSWLTGIMSMQKLLFSRTAMAMPVCRSKSESPFMN